MSANRPRWSRKLKLAVAGGVVVLLAAVVITLGSFQVPLEPTQGNELYIFFALSTLIAVTLLVFTLILSRSLIKLWTERRTGQLGSRFKVKMVLGAMGVSLLPLLFLFFFSYALVNRTLNTWFPRPLEIANEQSQSLVDDFTSRAHRGMSQEADAACTLIQQKRIGGDDLLRQAAPDADAIWQEEANGTVARIVAERPSATAITSASLKKDRVLPSRAEIWTGPNAAYVAARSSCGTGSMIVARAIPATFLERYDQVESQTQIYLHQRQRLRIYKREILLALLLVTMLLLFATTWVALFLSKQVTVPIQALAEATREISRGNFDHRVTTQAQDELGTLVRSFNRMTEQLGQGRRQINEFTRNLELAVEEREQRRKMMEAILENIPTGVISLNSSGEVTRANSAVAKILGDRAREARTLPELLGEEAARTVMHLMRRSLRMGAASREIEIAAGGRLARTAVTVSSLGPRRSNPGFVVVIDDLTELLQAQKAAAWQEVAQRIAHEIKNPLTPIQISAQRLLRYLDRTAKFQLGAPTTEFEKLAAECAGLIEREVSTLGSLVDEFSKFARFPAARLVPADMNGIVESALGLFQGRLEGIQVQAELAASLPQVRADAELIRRVLVNLIDNAAEAMEGSAVRELRVATRAGSDGDAVEIEISDSGPGISPADKERLFLPQFSTKDRGTGLGLAIASRIVAEHNGAIRVEDNQPAGSRFVIRFPALEVAASTRAAN